MGWTAAEARWRDAVLAAVLPIGATPLSADAWSAWWRAATPTLRWGFRAAVVLLTWSTVPRHGRPLHRLDDDARDAALARWAAREGLLARQVVLVAKTMAALVAFGPERR